MAAYWTAMGIDFSLLIFFNNVGLWLLAVFLAPVHGLQAVLWPWMPGLLTQLGLAPGALQPQLAVTVAIVLWCGIAVGMIRFCQLMFARITLFCSSLAQTFFRVRMRFRFGAGRLHQIVRRLRPENQIRSHGGEVNLPEDALRILRALADEPRGAAASAPELADKLAMEVRIVQRYLSELATLGLAESAVGSFRRHPNFCVSRSGSLYINHGFASA